MAAAAAGAAAAEEGMEPRALQYEQTLVSEASRALTDRLPVPVCTTVFANVNS